MASSKESIVVVSRFILAAATSVTFCNSESDTVATTGANVSATALAAAFRAAVSACATIVSALAFSVSALAMSVSANGFT